MKILSGWIFIFILFFVSPISSEAKVYKWVDDNGKTHYSDRPSLNSINTKTRVSPSLNASPKTNQQQKKDVKDFGKAMERLINPKGRINTCQKLADKIEQCMPFSCEMSHPLFGIFIVNNTISGMKNGKCHYEQTMPSDGLMTCNFSVEQRKQFAQLHRDMFSGKTIETNFSGKMEASIDIDSSGKTQSKSKITKNESYKVDGKETKNIMDDALKNGDCVITGY